MFQLYSINNYKYLLKRLKFLGLYSYLVYEVYRTLGSTLCPTGCVLPIAVALHLAYDLENMFSLIIPGTCPVYPGTCYS